ncbi:MAG: GNAT family N-acetyltransferase [Pseudomonadota bacterium]
MHEYIECHPATPDRWGDLEAVFAGRGDPAKCWCAYWYLPNKAFREGWGEGNRHVLKDRVEGERPPGVLAYVGGLPAGWAGVAPRSAFDRLVRNRQSLRAVDDRPVWSLTCLVVRRDFRRQGLMRPLIQGAVDFALSEGAIAIEAYPVDADRKLTMYDLFLGSLAAYQDIGFVEVARHAPTRPILRYWPET